GKVSAELVILSADLETGTLVISRNTQTPVLLYHESRWQALATPAAAIGIYPRTRPAIEEVPLRPGLMAIAFSDGVWHAGERRGGRIDLQSFVQSLSPMLPAEAFADRILERALSNEQGRPSDDLSVVVFQVAGTARDGVRRLRMSVPVPARISESW
ncbi:MAG: serine/threonine-protein phosphatase, partial [Chloroflexi bacterium]